MPNIRQATSTFENAIPGSNEYAAIPKQNIAMKIMFIDPYHAFDTICKYAITADENHQTNQEKACGVISFRIRAVT